MSPKAMSQLSLMMRGSGKREEGELMNKWRVDLLLLLCNF
jgi:hypothetical protein